MEQIFVIGIDPGSYWRSVSLILASRFQLKCFNDFDNIPEKSVVILTLKWSNTGTEH